MSGISGWVGLFVWKVQSDLFVNSVWYWKRRKSIFPLKLDKTYLGPNKLIIDILLVTFNNQRVLSLGRTHGGKLPTTYIPLCVNIIILF